MALRFRRALKTGYHSEPSAHQQEHQFQLRLLVALGSILFAFSLLLARFVYLQLYQHTHYTTLAQNNSISLLPSIPNRGLIVDRNGVILAQNYSGYTLEITPSKVGNLDHAIAVVNQLIEITPRDIKRFKKLMADTRNFESLPIKLKLSDQEVARFSSQAYRFPGVEIKARLFRDYPFKELTSHVIGYIGRINQADQDKLDDEGLSANYRGTTYIGKVGLEKVYEAQLHGTTGFEEVETDVNGHAIRTLRSIPPTSGDTLKLALDIRLQQEADKLFGDRRGALVAIDPSTGGVLAFLSKPGFDPNLFIDGIDSQSWKDLNDDWRKPLVNRALRGVYPPGSTFKPFMAMANLETGFRPPSFTIFDPGYFSLPGSPHRFRDSKKGGNGTVNLFKAIQVSSDTYFYKLAWDMGIDRLVPTLSKFDFGSPSGIDLDNEARGILPSKTWKARRFKGAASRWLPGDVVSIGIGQGYNAYTPLQMAHALSILANDGIVMRPHVVNQIINPVTGQITPVGMAPTRNDLFNQDNMTFVKNAMAAVLKPGGTAARIGAGLKYSMAGKTGTAQVVQIKQNAKYNAASLSEQHRDHSWFIAFAPVEAPRIAVAVIVENAGWGAAAAAPIARQLFDFYFLGEHPAPGQDAASLARAALEKQAQAPAADDDDEEDTTNAADHN